MGSGVRANFNEILIEKSIKCLFVVESGEVKWQMNISCDLSIFSSTFITKSVNDETKRYLYNLNQDCIYGVCKISFLRFTA